MGDDEDLDLAESHREFGMRANHIKVIADDLLTEYFGSRCPEFEPDCECCKRWAALDVLIENPFE